VDAAVSSIERTSNEQNRRVSVSRGFNTNGGGGADLRPTSRGSRVSTTAKETEGKEIAPGLLSNGDKEDDQMKENNTMDTDVPMDTTNDEDAMETDGMQANTDAAANAAEIDAKGQGMDDEELTEDPFNAPTQPLSKAHEFPNVFEPAEANEAPTIGSMNALRNIAMKGDRSSQLAFKIMQEFLISPNLGVGQQHMKPFMRALEKVPQYMNLEGTPFAYWQHFHPSLSGAPLTPDKELQYSALDKEEETAVAVVSDNLRYLLFTEGTIDPQSQFMDPSKVHNAMMRGRIPNSKHNFGIDEVERDSLFHEIRKGV